MPSDAQSQSPTSSVSIAPTGAAATPDVERFLKSVHPYDGADPDILAELIAAMELRHYIPGAQIYNLGAPLEGVFIIHSGQVEVRDGNNVPLSQLGVRNSFGERGLLQDGLAVSSARAVAETLCLVLPPDAFHRWMSQDSAAKRFFDRARPKAKQAGLPSTKLTDLMTPSPITCGPQTAIRAAAQVLVSNRISSICVVDHDTSGGAVGVNAQGGANAQGLVGILTDTDITKAVARDLPGDTKLQHVMTKHPRTLPSSAIGSDVLHMMMEHRISHIPVVDEGKLVGIVSQSDLTRFQAVNSAELVAEIARADSPEDMAAVTARIPDLLVQLVGAGTRHEVTTRLISDVADTVTRRLLTLAEAQFGTPPVPYLWLACGSQGRQEQTGVSDQDNCLILDDAVTAEDMGYFAKLATYVCDGLNTCGYVYCPGDMMATSPRWCQPQRIWRDYFSRWIKTPDPEAQMLASVMFDLRPIGGTPALFEDLQDGVLEQAGSNSIFVAHMVSNSLKHTAPLGLLRGFATIRSGEHKNTLDLKHNGVVPVVDLARVYALQGGVHEANTRARLKRAMALGVVSASGARDLIDAYDLIAETRLSHQARQIQRGDAPDNFMSPAELSDLERSHLRNAFVVVKSLQSALGHNRATVS